VGRAAFVWLYRSRTSDPWPDVSRPPPLMAGLPPYNRRRCGLVAFEAAVVPGGDVAPALAARPRRGARTRGHLQQDLHTPPPGRVDGREGCAPGDQVPHTSSATRPDTEASFFLVILLHEPPPSPPRHHSHP
jgi:hypothetical protein